MLKACEAKQRIQVSNLINTVSVIGEGKLEVSGSRVFPKSADHSVDHQHDNSDSGLGLGNNNWEVQSSRKHHRVDRSRASDNSHTCEKEKSPLTVVHQGTSHMLMRETMVYMTTVVEDKTGTMPTPTMFKGTRITGGITMIDHPVS